MKLTEVVEHFLLDLEIKGRTKATLVDYRHRLGILVRVLRDQCQVTDLEQVKVNHLRQVVQYLLNAEHPYERGRKCEGVGFAPVTVRAFVRIFKSFFHWCYQEELTDQVITTRLSPPKVPVRIRPVFTPAHIDKMLSSCDISDPFGFRDYVILLLLLDTGMRIGELSGLRLDDIHDRYVKVFGKGRREREIGLHPEVSKLLWKYVHKYRHPAVSNEQALFVGSRGEPLQLIGFQNILQRVRRASGLEDIKFSAHVFRHTFAKWYMNQGGDLFNLSRELGHSDVQITKIYLEDYTSTEARKEHSSYSPISSIDIKRNNRQKRKKE
jgi:integrase/recombinase XerD